MKYAAYFALITGLIAAVAALIIKINAIRKSRSATKQDKFLLVFLPIFALLMIANLVFVTLYF